MQAFFMMNPEDADKHQQAHSVASHEVNRLLEELDEEHLRVFGMVLDGLCMAERPRSIAHYMSGRVTMMMQTRFNVCAACGKNHEKDLESITADGDSVEVPPHVQARRVVDAQTEPAWTQVGSTDLMSPSELEKMAQYGLDDLRDEDTKQLIGFICINCQTRYPTIQDRMLREPGVEGCSGCQQKAKFG